MDVRRNSILLSIWHPTQLLSLKLSSTLEKEYKMVWAYILFWVYAFLKLKKNHFQYDYRSVHFCKNCNRLFTWLCPSLAQNYKTALRVFLNLHLLLVCLQNFTIPAAASLAKHFNFPTYANICYFNRKNFHKGGGLPLLTTSTSTRNHFYILFIVIKTFWVFV